MNVLAETLVALGRISKFLIAEDIPEAEAIDHLAKNAISVDGGFTWEVSMQPEEKGKGKKTKKEKKDEGLPTITPAASDDGSHSDRAEDPPFAFDRLQLKVPRGQFVAIVGPVGSGKVSFYSSFIMLSLNPDHVSRAQCFRPLSERCERPMVRYRSAAIWHTYRRRRGFAMPPSGTTSYLGRRMMKRGMLLLVTLGH